jgi:phenylalanyl-tRNA synthetase beta chain
MKFSYNWLKEISKTERSAEELIDLVMLKGFELEERIDLASEFKNFVVGEVKKVEKHPDADRLNVVSLNLGEFGQSVQIVCGAPNVAVGQKVPVALPGAILPNSKTEITKAEMRGVESNGMICAEDEIGLGKDHDGIMVLDENLEAGVDLAEALNLKDDVLDFDILPNRSHDCLSYQGLSREIATMENRTIDLNTDFPPQPKAGTAKADFKNTDYKKEGELLNIEIKEAELCPRYMGAV